MLKRRATKALPARSPLVESLGIGKTNQPARERWLERELLALPADSTILDAGAGERRYAKFCTHLQYTSQDFGRYDGSGDQVGLQKHTWDNTGLDIVSDITSIPVETRSFDAIMCVEVFEHLPRPLDALQEFQRILRPGGKLILTSPFCSLTHYSPHFYYTGYSEYFYRTHLPAYGFSIDKIERNGGYFDYLAQELVRLRSVTERYAPEHQGDAKRLRSALEVLLRELKSMSAADSGSSELACFGLHVLATRDRDEVYRKSRAR